MLKVVFSLFLAFIPKFFWAQALGNRGSFLPLSPLSPFFEGVPTVLVIFLFSRHAVGQPNTKGR